MYNLAAPRVVFPVAGALSGLCSGLSVMLPPLVLFLPGLLFGVAISYAIQLSWNPVSSGQRTLLIVVSFVAYPLAIVVALLTRRFTGFDDGILGGACFGAIGGGTGAFVLSLAVVVAIQDLEPLPVVIVVSIAGAVLGGLHIVVGIWISDHTAVGHPVDDIVSFTLWQTGVASAISLFYSPSEWPETPCGEPRKGEA